MAHIANRSRFRVTVKNKPDLTQHFSFSKVAAVEAYMKELRAQGYKPRAEQLDESWLVRIRERGHSLGLSGGRHVLGNCRAAGRCLEDERRAIGGQWSSAVAG